MRMINADDLEQALKEAGLAEVIKDDCSKCTSAWGVPIVDAEPVRHGKWIEQIVITDKKAIEEWQSAKCSVCGKYHTTPYMYYFSHYDYCPNCGAKMEEVDE